MPQFQQRRQQRRIRRIGERIDFNHRTGHHNPQVMNGDYQEIMWWGNYNNPQLQHRPDTPVNILREAFNEFIVNENIESNTLGIEIVYLENEGDTIAKNITIIKRKYDEPQPAIQTRRINNNNANHYLNINDINQAAHYPNTELNNLINQVRGFHRILQITLCEIYNDDPISIARRGTRDRANPNHINRYNPFTIPIRLLYRDMDPAMVPVRPIHRSEPGYVRPVLTPEQIALEEQRELERQQRAFERYQEREQASAALAIQRQQERQQEQTPEQQDALLNDPFFNNYEDLGEGENTVNPDPLQVVDNPELLNRPITSYHWPGMCQICQMNNLDEPLCRVDCKQRNRDGSLVPIGHIFHCECINAYHNTRTDYGWNNKCPLCNQRDYPNITSMVQLTPDKFEFLPTSFGKHSFGKRKGKNNLKNVDSDIKYLLKK